MEYYIKICSQQVFFLLPLSLVDKITDLSSTEDYDLFYLSNLFEPQLKSGSYVILIRNQNRALVVDAIEDVLEIDNRKIQSLNHVFYQKRLSFLKGVIMFQDEPYYVF